MAEVAHKPQYFVASYSMVPKGAPELEKEFLAGLAALPHCCGLELALTDDGYLNFAHSNDETWLLSTLKELGVLSRWHFIITLIPPTMAGISKDPHFGLASDNCSGRAAAVELGRKACAAISRLNEAAGCSPHTFVELHAGPTRHSAAAKEASVSSSSAALAASLKELRNLNWQSARLTLEHCDWHGGVAPVKGFLSLDEEIDALKIVNADEGTSQVLLTINWARSVLETHDAETAVLHIKAAQQAGLLGGVMFSGCSGVDGPYRQWDDSHMPHGRAEGIEHFAEGSLMTRSEMHKCLQAAGGPQGLAYVGAKLTAKHVGSRDVAARIGLYRDIQALLSAYNAELEGPPIKKACL